MAVHGVAEVVDVLDELASLFSNIISWLWDKTTTYHLVVLVQGCHKAEQYLARKFCAGIPRGLQPREIPAPKLPCEKL